MIEDIEKDIAKLASQGYSYKAIQLKLGSPSKKIIRNAIRKHNKELFDTLSNTKALHQLREELGESNK